MVFGDDCVLTSVDDSAHQFYVYAWFCKSWGDIPFYVGKGYDNRWKSMNGRSLQFRKIVEKFDCYSMILLKCLSEEQADFTEDEIKVRFVSEGMPLIDMEIKAKRKMAQREGINAMAVVNGKRYSTKKGTAYGRPTKVIPDFEKFLKKQKDGLMTVEECCKILGIGRSTWYAKVREVNV
jgi:t-SNARE complex subunit (syntaxin)